PVVRVTGQRFSLNMISAISPRGEVRFMVVKGAVGAAVFIRFLKRLIHGANRPIFLIADGPPAHRAKAVTQYMSTVSQRLRLFFLPAYAKALDTDSCVG